AETYLRAKVKGANTPTFADPTARKLSLPALLDVARREHARRGNRSRLEYKLAHLIAHFGETPALAITTEGNDGYTDERLPTGPQPATVNRELAALRHAFRLALRKGLLPTMPYVTLRPEDNTRRGVPRSRGLRGLPGGTGRARCARRRRDRVRVLDLPP